MTGRFAPSPTGPLHLGSLRTALVAWLAARTASGRFLLRVEDLDPVASRAEHEAGQLADLETLGLSWDGPVVRQSERRERHETALARLDAAELTYACYCTRQEIREASVAPHGELPDGAYPGTCRELTDRERAARLAEGRPPALRLRADDARVTIVDELHGEVTRRIDDFVLRRGDGVPAYNLAVVVDDAEQGVTQVVRGDDLLDSTPRQAHLADLLGLPRPSWAHVPMVLGPDGERLAKRHGSITLGQLWERGWTPSDVRRLLATSLGMRGHGDWASLGHLQDQFDLGGLPTEPWVLDPRDLDRP